MLIVDYQHAHADDEVNWADRADANRVITVICPAWGWFKPAADRGFRKLAHYRPRRDQYRPHSINLSANRIGIPLAIWLGSDAASQGERMGESVAGLGESS